MADRTAGLESISLARPAREDDGPSASSQWPEIYADISFAFAFHGALSVATGSHMATSQERAPSWSSPFFAAVLRQMPFKPLFERIEDDLIAYSFDQYLKTGEDDWPLLLPM